MRMDIEVNPRSRVRKSYVRFGSEADLLRSITLVRFVPIADIEEHMLPLATGSGWTRLSISSASGYSPHPMAE